MKNSIAAQLGAVSGKIIPLALLMGAFVLAAVPSARAQLSFTISPVAGHSDQYTLAVTSSSFVVAGANDSVGTLTTDATFFNGNFSSTPILTGAFGTASSGAPPEPAATQMLISGTSFGLQFASNLLGGGTSYGLTGGPATATIGTTYYYSDLNPGTYNITGGTGVFADASNYGGTLTVQAAAVPEPATYAGLMGLAVLGVVLWRRRETIKESGFNVQS